MAPGASGGRSRRIDAGGCAAGGWRTAPALLWRGRRHAAGAILALLTGLALAAGASPAQAQTARVVRHLPAGGGAAAVGLTPGGIDAEATGPAALYADDDGKLYLLDQVNGRILGLDGKVPERVPDAIRLPDTLAPSDLVAMRNRLYVWDGRPYALERAAQPGGVEQAAAAAPRLEARAVSDADDVARSAFAQMGSQTPASDGEALAAARSMSVHTLDMPVRQVLSTRTLGRVNADILPQKDGRSAIIELRPEADPLDARRIGVRVTDRLGLVEVLDIDSAGRTFLFTENVPAKAGQPPSIFVARYSAKGRLDAVFDLPVTPDQLNTRRFVTISPEGQVLFLRSDTSGVSILELPARRPRKDILEPPRSAPAPGPASAAAGGEPGYVTAVRANSRAGVIQTGLAFENLKWQVKPANYGADPDRACIGFDGRVRRPPYLQGKVNQEVRGVPYCWGCFGTLIQFQRRIESGALAGNWCTRETPRPDTVGVDCSAFVSAAWGLQRHYMTNEIPAITRRLENPWDLRPGDALNKPGAHVMLFVQFTPDRKVEVLEAATGTCNGRVCRNIYPLSVLLARGYIPVRYPLLTD